MMNLSDYIKIFNRKKDKKFLITGGAISFMLMHFPETKISYISVAHEQGAAMMADYIQDLGQIFHVQW